MLMRLIRLIRYILQFELLNLDWNDLGCVGVLVDCRLSLKCIAVLCAKFIIRGAAVGT
jgi:hypothetical protein